MRGLRSSDQVGSMSVQRPSQSSEPKWWHPESGHQLDANGATTMLDAVGSPYSKSVTEVRCHSSKLPFFCSIER